MRSYIDSALRLLLRTVAAASEIRRGLFMISLFLLSILRHYTLSNINILLKTVLIFYNNYLYLIDVITNISNAYEADFKDIFNKIRGFFFCLMHEKILTEFVIKLVRPLL